MAANLWRECFPDFHIAVSDAKRGQIQGVFVEALYKNFIGEIGNKRQGYNSKKSKVPKMATPWFELKIFQNVCKLLVLVEHRRLSLICLLTKVQTATN